MDIVSFGNCLHLRLLRETEISVTPRKLCTMDGHAAFALKQKRGLEAKLESFRRREPLAALRAFDLLRIDAANLVRRNRLKCLTFQDVQELARMEVPAFLGPPQLGEHVRPQIDVTLGSSLPHDLYVASLLAQLLLFFMLVHFGAFVREAVSSPNFPAPGTLFSAFSRSRSGLLVFGFATLIPPLASALVFWASWTSESCFSARLYSPHSLGIFLGSNCSVANSILQQLDSSEQQKG